MLRLYTDKCKYSGISQSAPGLFDTAGKEGHQKEADSFQATYGTSMSGVNPVKESKCFKMNK